MALISCDDDAPPAENEEEVISIVTLTFTPENGGDALTFTYSDPEGEGNTTIETITLAPNTTYTLNVALAGVEGEDMTQEIETEADEHMFFYGWTGNLFTNPSGSGNLTSRNGTVIYEDEDSQEQPLGLVTTWTTSEETTGTFTIILKHQPEIKSGTSTAMDGETDIEIVWPAVIL